MLLDSGVTVIVTKTTASLMFSATPLDTMVIDAQGSLGYLLNVKFYIFIYILAEMVTARSGVK